MTTYRRGEERGGQRALAEIIERVDDMCERVAEVVAVLLREALPQRVELAEGLARVRVRVRVELAEGLPHGKWGHGGTAGVAIVSRLRQGGDASSNLPRNSLWLYLHQAGPQ